MKISAPASRLALLSSLIVVLAAEQAEGEPTPADVTATRQDVDADVAASSAAVDAASSAGAKVEDGKVSTLGNLNNNDANANDLDDDDALFDDDENDVPFPPTISEVVHDDSLNSVPPLPLELMELAGRAAAAVETVVDRSKTLDGAIGIGEADGAVLGGAAAAEVIHGVADGADGAHSVRGDGVAGDEDGLPAHSASSLASSEESGTMIVEEVPPLQDDSTTAEGGDDDTRRDGGSRRRGDDGNQRDGDDARTEAAAATQATAAGLAGVTEVESSSSSAEREQDSAAQAASVPQRQQEGADEVKKEERVGESLAEATTTGESAIDATAAAAAAEGTTADDGGAGEQQAGGGGGGDSEATSNKAESQTTDDGDDPPTADSDADAADADADADAAPKEEGSSDVDGTTVTAEQTENSESEKKADDKDGKDDEEDEEGGTKNRVVVDYANKSAGALILEKSSSMKGANNLLNSDNDKYAIAPCDERKYVVLGLSEDILVKQVKIANYERYSSHPKEFEILGSQTYPEVEWVDLGTYTAQPGNGEQTFDLIEPTWARYLKLRFVTHYGSEHYCTVSQVRVHGSTMLQGFHEQWRESEKEAKEILEAVGDGGGEGGEDVKEEGEAKETETETEKADNKDTTEGEGDGEEVKEVGGEGKVEEGTQGEEGSQGEGGEATGDVPPVSGGGHDTVAVAAEAAAAAAEGEAVVPTDSPGGGAADSEESLSKEPQGASTSAEGDEEITTITEEAGTEEDAEAKTEVETETKTKTKTETAEVRTDVTDNESPPQDAAEKEVDKVSGKDASDETSQATEEVAKAEEVSTSAESGPSTHEKVVTSEGRVDVDTAKRRDQVADPETLPEAKAQTKERASTEDKEESPSPDAEVVSASSTAKRETPSPNMDDAIDDGDEPSNLSKDSGIDAEGATTEASSAVTDAFQGLSTCINVSELPQASFDVAVTGATTDALSCASIARESADSASSDSLDHAAAGGITSMIGNISSMFTKAAATEASEAIRAVKEIQKIITTKISVGTHEGGKEGALADASPDAPRAAGSSDTLKDETSGGAKGQGNESKGQSEESIKSAGTQKGVTAEEKAHSAPKEEGPTPPNEGSPVSADVSEDKKSTPSEPPDDMAKKDSDAASDGAVAAPKKQHLSHEDAAAVSKAEAEILAALSNKFPAVSCLEGLNFQEFKAKVMAGRGGTKAVNAPNAPGVPGKNAPGGPGKIEPIFKTLTDEIKTLQINQSVYDQYLKALTMCYQRIILDVTTELNTVENGQAQRLSELESAIRALQSDEGHQRSPTYTWTSSLVPLLWAAVSSVCAFVIALAVETDWSSLVADIASLGRSLEWKGIALIMAGTLVIILLFSRPSAKKRSTQDAQVPRQAIATQNLPPEEQIGKGGKSSRDARTTPHLDVDDDDTSTLSGGSRSNKRRFRGFRPITSRTK